MNAKAKGARAERRARAILEARGWTVIRAGGSLGPFDLVAVSRSGLRLLQIKCNRGPGRRERAALAAFNNMPRGATRELWLFRDRNRTPQIEVFP
jgi:Holliday junction resolvase